MIFLLQNPTEVNEFQFHFHIFFNQLNPENGPTPSNIFTTDPTCPTIPCPVIASVTTASTNPIIAARPFSCSENGVNPCGTDLSSDSALMCTVERALLGTATRFRL